MSVTLVKSPITLARPIGAADGKAAASWAFDGNTATHIYAAFLEGYESGDPLIMDYYDAGSPLSGEWADGLTAPELAASLGVIATADDTDGMVDAIADAYELAFSDAYYGELVRVATLHTSGE